MESRENVKFPEHPQITEPLFCSRKAGEQHQLAPCRWTAVKRKVRWLRNYESDKVKLRVEALCSRRRNISIDSPALCGMRRGIGVRPPGSAPVDPSKLVRQGMV